MIITMIFSIVVKVQFSSSFHVQKCCNMHQRLSADLKSCVDLRAETDQGNEINSSFVYEWHLPNDTKILSSRDSEPVTSSFELEIFHKNGSEESFFQSYKNVFPLDERIFLFNNGSLFVTNKILHASMGTGLYPPWSFCLDDISQENCGSPKQQQRILSQINFAILLQSKCKVPCIRRCCPEHMYLLEQRCKNFSNVPKNWIHQILPPHTSKWNSTILNK